MNYSVKLFKDSMPEWKKKKDPIICRIIHRPLSYIAAAFFSNIGLTANQVSFVALISAIFTVICFLVNNYVCNLLGAVMVSVWCIIDCADGNMARALGYQPFGGFIDSLSSYFLVGFMFPALGMCVFRSGGLFFNAGSGWIIYLGAFASACDTMTRLFNQKMKSSIYEREILEGINSGLTQDAVKGRPETKIEKLYTIVESEFGLGGWNQVAIIVCVVFNWLDCYIIFYDLYYGGMFLIACVYVLKKTKCLRNKG